MHPAARPPLADPTERAWWLRGLLWWGLFLGLLVLAVHECS
jgi:hypothetical protein